MDISATDSSGQGTPSPEKFLASHSGEFHISDWLTLGLFEAIVWGGRFEPLYLLPYPIVFYYAQGLVGFPDNSFIGLSASVKLPNAVRADFLLNVDDAGFNQLIRLDFNMMLLIAFQAGVSWTPNWPWLVRLKLTNLLVTPYTYSHKSSDPDPAKPNYLNYTNAGQNIGPSIQPNSDRIELSALMRPIPMLDFNVFSRFIIHGNASDGHSSGDGTIFDDGYNGDSATFKTGTRFLSQDILEKTIQAGFDAKAWYDTPIGQIQGTLSYTFEYVLNAGLTRSSDLNNYLGLGLGFRY
jgi:hypothetical protein